VVGGGRDLTATFNRRGGSILRGGHRGGREVESRGVCWESLDIKPFNEIRRPTEGKGLSREKWLPRIERR